MIYNLLASVAVFLIQTSIDILSVLLSRGLHKDIVSNLLHASFPKYYNKVMTGRLLNRLSRDIQNVDLNLSQQISLTVFMIFGLAAVTLQFVIYRAVIILPAVIVYFIACLILFIYYMSSIRELTRLEAISKTPILSFFNEIARGAVYCRSCISESYIFGRYGKSVNQDLRNLITKQALQSLFFSYINYLNVLFLCIIEIIMVSLSLFCFKSPTN